MMGRQHCIWSYGGVRRVSSTTLRAVNPARIVNPAGVRRTLPASLIDSVQRESLVLYKDGEFVLLEESYLFHVICCRRYDCLEQTFGTSSSRYSNESRLHRLCTVSLSLESGIFSPFLHTGGPKVSDDLCSHLHHWQYDSHHPPNLVHRLDR